MRGRQLVEDLRRLNDAAVREGGHREEGGNADSVWHSLVPSGPLGRERLIVILRDRGCSYAVAGAGPCFNCGLTAASGAGNGVPDADLVRQLEKVLEGYDFRQRNVVEIDLFNAGSFLDDCQVSPGLRRELLEIVASIETVTDVLIDARPEDVTGEKVSALKSSLGGRRAWVGIGLETTDDWIRTLCINKSFSLAEFERAAEVIADHSCGLFAYLMFKPAFLTESEAVGDALESVRYLAALAARKKFPLRISLEPGVVQGDCLLTQLYAWGLYRPPWLWSVVQVVAGAHESARGRLRVGIPEEVPLVTARRGNFSAEGDFCACTVEIEKSIEEYNRGKDPAVFEDLPRCRCRSLWKDFMEEERERSRLPLEERARDAVAAAGRKGRSGVP